MQYGSAKHMKQMIYNRTWYSVVFLSILILMNTKMCPYAKPVDDPHINILMKIILTYIHKIVGDGNTAVSNINN